MSSLNLLLASAGLGAVLTSRLQASDAAEADYFGKSVVVSSDGSTAVIGAPNDDNSSGTNAGSVYIFTRSGTTWAEQARLQASDGAASDGFGSTVALSSDGNTLAVGAMYDALDPWSTADGSVYIFTRTGTTWTEQAKLTAVNDYFTNIDYFGNAIALSSSGNTLAVAAINDDNSGGQNAGSVFVFIRNGTTWTQQTRLQASDAAANDGFGYSVALNSDGNTLAIGAPYDDNSRGTNAGSVYIFTRSGTAWTEQSRLQASDAIADDYFGSSVTLSSTGNILAVGSYNGESAPSGAVYTFARSGTAWIETSKLLPSEYGSVAVHFYFGTALSFSSDAKTLLVGSYVSVPYGPGLSYPIEAYQGMAFLFKNYGSGWVQKAVLRATGPLSYDSGFGKSVSLTSDGNTAVVGDYGYTTGSAYVVKNYVGTDKSYWINGLQLYARDTTTSSDAYRFFGYATAISTDGNTLAVGAYESDIGSSIGVGYVYIFVRNNNSWTQQARLQASIGSQYDYFGYSISVSSDGNTVAIGAPNDDNSGGTDAGSVYIFTRSGSTWSEQTRLQASDAATYDYFGYSVALNSDGNTLAVGANVDDNSGGSNAGSVYIFTRSGSTWTEQAILQASDRAAGDYFGHSVALNSDGNTLAVGAPYDDTGGSIDAGSAYIFTRSGSTWSEQARVQASDFTDYSSFGISVALNSDGNTLVVGAAYDTNSGGTNAGSAYVFTRNGTSWTFQSKIVASDAASLDYFGRSVTISGAGTTVAIGSYQDRTDNSGIYSGSVTIRYKVQV